MRSISGVVFLGLFGRLAFLLLLFDLVTVEGNVELHVVFFNDLADFLIGEEVEAHSFFGDVFGFFLVAADLDDFILRALLLILVRVIFFNCVDDLEFIDFVDVFVFFVSQRNEYVGYIALSRIKIVLRISIHRVQFVSQNNIYKIKFEI